MKKFTMRVLCVLLMVVVALSMFACTSPNKVEAGKNLVVNGSFEDGLNGWTPSINTEISEITLKSHAVGSDDYTNYGASYLSMFNYTEEIAVLKQKIKIESGATYRLSAVVYVGNALTGENEKTLVGAHIGFGENVHFIDSTGWVPVEPLHPLRPGHRTIAEHLAAEIKKILGE